MLLINLAELQPLYAVTVEACGHGLHEVRLEVCIDDEYDAFVRIELFHRVAPFCHGRAECEEVLLCPSLILILAKEFAAPAVVRASADKDDIRVAQIWRTSDE